MKTLLTDNIISNSQPDTEKLLEMVNIQIKELTNNIFQRLVHTQRQGIDLLWNNPNLSPQEIIDSLEDSSKVFQFHGALTEFIKYLASIDGVNIDLKYPNNAFEIVDGKIVVLDTPYVVE